MKAIEKIRNEIDSLPIGKPFTANSFRHLAMSDNVRQILNRLVKSGEIKRVSRGVYSRSHKDPLKAKALPLAREIAETLTKSTGEMITVQGAEAARLLQLSTQVPMQLILYTNGNSRQLEISKRIVTLKHVNPSKLIKPGTPIGLAITALYYLGKERVDLNTIDKIKSQLTKNDFLGLFHEVNNMPSWMADVFFKYKIQKDIVDV